MLANKKFEKSLFDQFDNQVFEALERHFDAQGMILVRNPDKYGVDAFLFDHNGKLCNVEFECKSVWSGPDFPYESVDLPKRKMKFTSSETHTLFYIVNRELTHAFYFNATKVLSSPEVIKFCKPQKKFEPFIRVDIEQCRFCELQTRIIFSWQKVV